MFASTALSVMFTVLFLVTAVYSLGRLARLLAGQGPPGDRLVELFHLVMSLAMLGMTWAWTGSPPTASGVLQLVVFGTFTAWFAYGAITRTTAHGHLANGYHLAMGAAMIWMVAAMPVLMGGSGHAGTSGGHHGSADSAPDTGGDQAAMSVSPPGWVIAVSVVLAGLLLLAAGWWLLRAVRADDPIPEYDVASDSTVAVRTEARTGATTAVRINAACHVLMSIGMAGMLVAML